MPCTTRESNTISKQVVSALSPNRTTRMSGVLYNIESVIVGEKSENGDHIIDVGATGVSWVTLPRVRYEKKM